MSQLSQQGKTHAYDVLVLGTGVAGLQYCLELSQRLPKIKIALISKTDALESNSRYAQGGIAAPLGPKDTIESHILDTLNAGDGLCHLPAVEGIIQEAPAAIKKLSEYSVAFDSTQTGEYLLANEGGHSHRRVLSAGDQTGLTITQVLLEKTKQLSNIDCYQHHIAVNLITAYYPHDVHSLGEVVGAYILDCTTHLIHTFRANCVILATGGAGKTFRYTSNPMVATGDGLAMAYRAGARVGNLEFYQFHPTILFHDQLNNFLISEAVRGEGAILRNSDTNVRFMDKYAPELELATRDIVARAIFNEMEQSTNNFVYLDITHQSKAFLKQRFPKIYETLSTIGIDMSQDFIPVVPGAHYQCGGVLTDTNGQTDLKRLYAIGEVAFTGLHGANRLASNSLLEAMVIASKAVNASISYVQSPISESLVFASWSSPSEINHRRASQINAHWRSLRGEMTSYAGIIRTEAGLQDLLSLIIKRHHIIEDYYWKHWITRDFIELRNIVLVAELIVRSALARKESRGGHYREDYPSKLAQASESILSIYGTSNSKSIETIHV